MGCPIGVNSLFGPADKYIKFQGGDAIAVEGPNTVQRQILNDIRFPYEQVLHSKLVLRKGQVNYLLNHLGLGDNATFLLIAARYDAKSRIEEDNYVKYNYYSDFSRTYTFAQALLLTGNSTNRIPQLYLTNPNATYSVSLEVMVANIDDIYNYFEDVVNQSGSSFTGLSASSIHSFVVGESIVIRNSDNKDLIYIQIVNINSLQLITNIVILNDHIIGDVFLQFVSDAEAAQAFSLLNYVLENPNVNIDTLSPLEDLIKPVITFKSKVGGNGDWIYFMGSSASVPYSTEAGNTFSTSISIDTYGTQSQISKERLIEILISSARDNRDGTMSITASNILLTGTQGSVNYIGSLGSYSMQFDFKDLALNDLNSVILNLTIN